MLGLGSEVLAHHRRIAWVFFGFDHGRDSTGFQSRCNDSRLTGISQPVEIGLIHLCNSLLHNTGAIVGVLGLQQLSYCGVTGLRRFDQEAALLVTLNGVLPPVQRLYTGENLYTAGKFSLQQKPA